MPPNDPRVLILDTLSMRIDERRWYYRQGIVDAEGKLVKEARADDEETVELDEGGLFGMFTRAPEIFANAKGQEELRRIAEERFMHLMDEAGRGRA